MRKDDVSADICREARVTHQVSIQVLRQHVRNCEFGKPWLHQRGAQQLPVHAGVPLRQADVRPHHDVGTERDLLQQRWLLSAGVGPSADPAEALPAQAENSCKQQSPICWPAGEDSDLLLICRVLLSSQSSKGFTASNMILWKCAMGTHVSM